MYRVARCAFSGLPARYFLITRTVWIVVTPGGTQASLSLLGTPSSSSCTRKPSAKPSTHPRHVASRWMRAASLFPSLSMLEQISEKSRPDLLISGCSGAFFGPVLAGDQTKKIASSEGTRSWRTAASDPLRDSTSDLGGCQQSETIKTKRTAQPSQRICRVARALDPLTISAPCPRFWSVELLTLLFLVLLAPPTPFTPLFLPFNRQFRPFPANHLTKL